MRDRLIELIKQVPYGVNVGAKFEQHFCEKIADHLLANGVIVPKIKVGNKVYRCDTIHNKVVDWYITRIDVYEDEIVYCDDSYNVITADELGKTVFLTKEEAERALKSKGE